MIKGFHDLFVWLKTDRTVNYYLPITIKGISGLVQLITEIYIARKLGIGLYGMFTVTRTLAFLVQVYGDFGVAAGVIRYGSYYIGKNKEYRIKQMIVDVVIFQLIISLFIISIVLMADYFFPDVEKISLLTIFSVIFPFFFLKKTILGIFRFTNNNFLATLYESLFYQGIPLLVAAYLISNEASVENAVYGYIVGYMIVSIIALFITVMLLRNFPRKFKYKKWIFTRQLLSMGFPITFSNFGYQLLQRTDQLMLSAILGDGAAGVYSAAQKLTLGVQKLVDPIGKYLIYKTSRLLGEGNIAEIYNEFRLARNINLFFSIIVFMPMLVFSSEIIHITFGQEYEQSADVLIVLVVATIIYIISNLYASIAISFKDIKLINIVFWGCGLSNILLSYFFIISNGLIGAAYATLISSIFLYTFLLNGSRKWKK
jgi:O-antigen/teichoic acid export membrane protein